MWKSKHVIDLEGGSTPLYPMMLESPELRWAFIRKIYTIVTLQLLLTVAVAYVVVRVPQISNFFVSYYWSGLAIYICIIIFYVIVLVLVCLFYRRHPLNLLLLALFTTTLALLVGVTCAFTKGEVILEAAILTAVVVITLTLYTFWAAKRGHDFNFMGSFLSGALAVIICSSLLQIFFPLGPISTMLYGGLASIIFCGYIIYDTDNLIKRYSYDEYILAALTLYLDIINLFLHLLSILAEKK
ncbi:Protein LIFEGUARD 2 [Ranunculus cassubicifolius]